MAATTEKVLEDSLSWEPLKVPQCTVLQLDLACVGFPCYGGTGAVHRVSDPPCHLASPDDGGGQQWDQVLHQVGHGAGQYLAS